MSMKAMFDLLCQRYDENRRLCAPKYICRHTPEQLCGS